ncbi:hypothetical protein TNCV_3524361 [Trichonephila clavipes]|uniref:Uncharacterized protein n=1 Tax=Trichonephila clavipes TaxID=2585209 RepID=A0A8X6S8D0_TRICX|nr:hypothetical protein TNCV_3524361 [Trichonephila clavipes]
MLEGRYRLPGSHQMRIRLESLSRLNFDSSLKREPAHNNPLSKTDVFGNMLDDFFVVHSQKDADYGVPGLQSSCIKSHRDCYP